MIKYILSALLMLSIGACDSSPKQTMPQSSAVSESSAIEQAKKKARDFSTTLARARALGLNPYCSGYMTIAERAENNPKLRDALLLAKTNGIGVCTSDRFTVNEGFVVIDSAASDEEIIKFLSGE